MGEKIVTTASRWVLPSTYANCRAPSIFIETVLSIFFQTASQKTARTKNKSCKRMLIQLQTVRGGGQELNLNHSISLSVLYFRTQSGRSTIGDETSIYTYYSKKKHYGTYRTLRQNSAWFECSSCVLFLDVTRKIKLQQTRFTAGKDRLCIFP